jgi:hypothetical protein
LAFPIRDTLRHELSWSHYRLFLPKEEELKQLIDQDRMRFEIDNHKTTME